jgi:hypothetical protein
MENKKSDQRSGSNSKLLKWFPYIFITSMLTANYISGVKLVQWGIPSLGRDNCGVLPEQLNLLMALMAIISCIVAIISGILLDKVSLKFKSRLLLLLVGFGIQGSIAFFGTFISTPAQFTAWILVFSAILGFLICQPFVFMFLLIPSKHRGILAGVITGLAYIIGNFSMAEWTYAGLSMETIAVTIPLGILIVYAMFNLQKMKIFDYTPEKDENYSGQYAKTYKFAIVVLLMFGVYFVDSFGFLRIAKQDFFQILWHGVFGVKMYLGISHLIAAVIMGYIYQKKKHLGPIIVFISALCGFVLCDFLFSSDPTGPLLYITSYLYCATVSFYTINSFTVWSDISTSKNISSRAGIGIGIGGWLSSFLSTSLTEQLLISLPGDDGYRIHLMLSGVIAIGFLVIALITFKKIKSTK